MTLKGPDVVGATGSTMPGLVGNGNQSSAGLSGNKKSSTTNPAPHLHSQPPPMLAGVDVEEEEEEEEEEVEDRVVMMMSSRSEEDGEDEVDARLTLTPESCADTTTRPAHAHHHPAHNLPHLPHLIPHHTHHSVVIIQQAGVSPSPSGKCPGGTGCDRVDNDDDDDDNTVHHPHHRETNPNPLEKGTQLPPGDVAPRSSRRYPREETTMASYSSDSEDLDDSTSSLDRQSDHSLGDARAVDIHRTDSPDDVTVDPQWYGDDSQMTSSCPEETAGDVIHHVEDKIEAGDRDNNNGVNDNNNNNSNNIHAVHTRDYEVLGDGSNRLQGGDNDRLDAKNTQRENISSRKEIRSVKRADRSGRLQGRPSCDKPIAKENEHSSSLSFTDRSDSEGFSAGDSRHKCVTSEEILTSEPSDKDAVVQSVLLVDDRAAEKSVIVGHMGDEVCDDKSQVVEGESSFSASENTAPNVCSGTEETAGDVSVDGEQKEVESAGQEVISQQLPQESQRQRSLGPEASCGGASPDTKPSKAQKQLQRSSSYPEVKKKVLFTPIRPSPEESGLFPGKQSLSASQAGVVVPDSEVGSSGSCATSAVEKQTSTTCATHVDQSVEAEVASSSCEQTLTEQDTTSLLPQASRDVGLKRQKAQPSNPPVARVNPQANPNASQPLQQQQHQLQQQQQQQQQLQQQQLQQMQQQQQQQQQLKMQQQIQHQQAHQYMTYCQQMFPGSGGGFFLSDSSGGFFPSSGYPVLYVQGPGGSYYVTQDFSNGDYCSAMPGMTQTAATHAPSSSKLLPPPAAPSPLPTGSEVKYSNPTEVAGKSPQPQVCGKTVPIPACVTSTGGTPHKDGRSSSSSHSRHGLDPLTDVTACRQGRAGKEEGHHHHTRRGAATPPGKRRHKQPLLPDPMIPKFSELASMVSPALHSHALPAEILNSAMQLQQQQQQHHHHHHQQHQQHQHHLVPPTQQTPLPSHLQPHPHHHHHPAHPLQMLPHTQSPVLHHPHPHHHHHPASGSANNSPPVFSADLHTCANNSNNNHTTTPVFVQPGLSAGDVSSSTLPHTAAVTPSAATTIAATAAVAVPSNLVSGVQGHGNNLTPTATDATISNTANSSSTCDNPLSDAVDFGYATHPVGYVTDATGLVIYGPQPTSGGVGGVAGGVAGGVPATFGVRLDSSAHHDHIAHTLPPPSPAQAAAAVAAMLQQQHQHYHHQQQQQLQQQQQQHAQASSNSAAGTEPQETVVGPASGLMPVTQQMPLLSPRQQQQ
ncbi:alpha-protein kinase 1, partial [Aplysia californica]|uniref:Alpha-protein kinase 1 n=1 Tax=Aplysia californica TaxID=6500 RepID=A0ABM0KBA5_APLCA